MPYSPLDSRPSSRSTTRPRVCFTACLAVLLAGWLVGGCAWLGLGGSPEAPPAPAAPATPAAPSPTTERDIQATRADQARRSAQEALPAPELAKYDTLRIFFAMDPAARLDMGEVALRRLGGLILAQLGDLAANPPRLVNSPNGRTLDATVVYERYDVDRPGLVEAPASTPPLDQPVGERSEAISALVTLADASSGQPVASYRVEKSVVRGGAYGLGASRDELERDFALGVAAAILGRPDLSGASATAAPAP